MAACGSIACRTAFVRPSVALQFQAEVLAGNWMSLAPLPVARGDAAMTVVPSRFGDRLVVMGGESQVRRQQHRAVPPPQDGKPATTCTDVSRPDAVTLTASAD